MGLMNRKPRWLNPQESTGIFLRKMGPINSCWEAINTARDEFLKIGPEIGDYLTKYGHRQQYRVTWTLYMIGRTPETARPTLIFSCKDYTSRKNVRNIVEESGILDKYPAVAIGDGETAPDFGSKLVEPAGGTNPIITYTTNSLAGLQGDRYDRIYPVPLDSAREEIRLLTIEPGPLGSLLICSLATVSLMYSSAIPNFVAIVDQGHPMLQQKYKSSIRLNGQLCQIPVDVEEILRQSRFESTVARIWLRPLCVNLADNEETSERSNLWSEIKHHSNTVKRLRDLIDTSLIYQYAQESSSKQILLSRRLSNACIIRKATMGPVFRTGEKYFSLTVAHVLLDRPDDTWVGTADDDTFDLDFGDDYFSDEDEETKDLVASTSRASLTPEPTDHTGSDTASSATDNADAPHDLATRLQESVLWKRPEINQLQSKGKGKEISFLESPSEVQGHVAELVDFVGTLAFSSYDDNYAGLDYSVIEIKQPYLETFNEITFSTDTKTTTLYPQNVVEKIPQSAAVFAVTGSAGVLSGHLSGVPTYATDAVSDSIHELWTVRLDGKLADGDCGSLVVDAENGNVMGHIVAGNLETGVAYIVPTYRVLADIRAKYGLELMLATRQNSVKRGTQRRDKVKAQQDPLGLMDAWLGSSIRREVIDNMSASSSAHDSGYVGSSSAYDPIFKGPSYAHSNESVASFRSRITLVEYGNELRNRPKSPENTGNTIAIKPKNAWLDHLLRVFTLPANKAPIKSVVSDIIASQEDFESENDSMSPWIIPIYVVCQPKLSDPNIYPTVKAQCIVDTGNMQGNLVSQEMVSQLGITPDKYQELMEGESQSHLNVTGHALVPEGAVYLTWYHENSTRVYRDMRFLVIPGIGYDIIIGARSALKNNLLTAPNLTLPKPLAPGRLTGGSKPRATRASKPQTKELAQEQLEDQVEEEQNMGQTSNITPTLDGAQAKDKSQRSSDTTTAPPSQTEIVKKQRKFFNKLFPKKGLI